MARPKKSIEEKDDCRLTLNIPKWLKEELIQLSKTKSQTVAGLVKRAIVEYYDIEGGNRET